MKNYENYLIRFDYLPYLEKVKYGKWTGDYTKEGYLIYKPLEKNDFERKLLLSMGFSDKWNTI